MVKTVDARGTAKMGCQVQIDDRRDQLALMPSC
jgi:hypothetical protein